MQKLAATVALLALSTGLLHGLERHVLSANFTFVEAIDAECRSAPVPQRSLQHGCIHRAGHGGDSLCGVMRAVGTGRWLTADAAVFFTVAKAGASFARSAWLVLDVLAVAPKGSPPAASQFA